MNTEKIMEDIQSVQDNIREIKSTWGNTIMTLDNIKSGLKADVQKKADEAYQRGLEDGKWKAEDGCTGCKYEGNAGEHLPCEYCMNNFTNQWTAKPSDRIEVGDEVEDSDGDKTIVTNIHGNLFDGLCSDGSVMSDLFLDDNHKTGKHYDIRSILEAMRT